jgi:hypothetical protein
LRGRAVSRGVAVAFLALLGGCLPLLAAAPTRLASSVPRGPVRVGLEDGVAVSLSEDKAWPPSPSASAATRGSARE